MDLENYTIKTEVFEGPLDVLLSLIEKRKLSVSDISLAKVADDYISYVRSLEALPLADTAQFVFIASTLILIKSKSLLPNLELTTEEEQSIDDLEHRLKLRKQYKELGLHIHKLFGKHIMFSALPRRQTVTVFVPDRNTTQSGLLAKIKLVLASVPKIESLPKTMVKKVVSLEETILSLLERVNKTLKLNFREFAQSSSGGQGKTTEKTSLIVSFLAMLELVKQGNISVRQDRAFHDIEMELNTVGVPRY